MSKKVQSVLAAFLVVLTVMTSIPFVGFAASDEPEVICEHLNQKDMPQQDATCTAIGYTAGVYCEDCETWLSGHEEIAAVPHKFTEYTPNGDATCTKNGTETATCEVCKEVLKTEEIPMIDHVESDWIIDKEATCTEAGSKHTECTACKKVFQTEEIPMIDHVESDWIIDKEATCTEAGSKHTECTACKKVFQTEEIPMIDHVESDWIIDKEATCTEVGSMHTECTACKKVFQAEEIPMIDHIESDWIIDKEATCTETGAKHKECTVCQTKLAEEEIEKLPHTESDWIIDKEATCTEAGAKHKECTVCQTKLAEEEIEKLPHTESDWIIDREPTCTVLGEKHTECTVCHNVLQREDIEKLPHKYKYEVIKPTCTDGGYTKVTCENCDSYAEIDHTDCLGHDWTEWETKTPATCTENGEETRSCKRCDKVETRTVDALGHTPVTDAEVPATCTATGLTEGSHCSVCGEVLTEQKVIPAKGHIESDWVIQEPTCEEIGIKYTRCTVCGEMLQLENTPANGHTESDWIYSENYNCENGGSRHKDCLVCGKTVITEELKPTEHTYTDVVTEPTCTKAGYTTHTCTVCAKVTVDTEVEALGHEVVVDEAKEPTCTETGLKEGSHCSRCNEILVAQEVIPANGHSFNESEWIGVKAASCEEDGLKYNYCTVCEEKVDVIIPALGHVYPNWVISKQPTCSEYGERSRQCQVCKKIEYDRMDKLAHTPVVAQRIEPTCSKAGMTERTYCADCGTTLVPGEIIPMKAHVYTSAITKKATCAATGVKTYTCKNCNHKKTETIAKLTTHGKTTAKVTAAATTSKAGKIANQCSVCKKTLSTTTIAAIKTTTLAKTTYTYDGKAKTPAVTVKDTAGKALKLNTDYTVTYSANKAIGTATATIKFKGKYSGSKKLTYKITLGKPSAVSASQTTSTIKLTWSKVAGAAGYRIYLYNTKTKKFATVVNTTKTSYQFTKLKAGTTYKYAVRAYRTLSNKKVEVAPTYTVISTATNPSTPTVTVSAGSKQAKISWKNVTGAMGYQIYMSTSKNGNYQRVATVKNATSYTHKKLTKGKTYYYKVRAYKTIGNVNFFSSFSSPKSVKVK